MLLALLVALALQMGSRSLVGEKAAAAQDLPAPPSPALLRLAALGEEAATARLLMLYLQAFDLGGTNALPYRNLDYERLSRWLEALLELDPQSSYPLFAAARVYAEVPDEARSRTMLELVHRKFVEDPDRRWPWLAHAALLAKHRWNDLPLARRYAADLERLTRHDALPLWARQMQVFILEDMNELEAAKVMLGGLLASGQITDPAEARFLQQRLEALEARLAPPGNVKNRQ